MDQHLVDKCCHRTGNNNYDQDRLRHCILLVLLRSTPVTRDSGSLLATNDDNASSHHSQRSGYNANQNSCVH